MDWLDSADPALMRRLLDCRRTAASLPGPAATEEILAKVRRNGLVRSSYQIAANQSNGTWMCNKLTFSERGSVRRRG